VRVVTFVQWVAFRGGGAQGGRGQSAEREARRAEGGGRRAEGGGRRVSGVGCRGSGVGGRGSGVGGRGSGVKRRRAVEKKRLPYPPPPSAQFPAYLPWSVSNERDHRPLTLPVGSSATVRC
jgi:hypothetical protein